MIDVSWALFKSELKSPTPMERRDDRSTEPLAMTGFWRLRAPKTRIDWPVMIFTEADEEKNPTGATIFQIGANVMNTIEHTKEWQGFLEKTWLKCDAVERADYAKALQTGWWGEPVTGKPAKKMTIEERLGIEIPTSGGNAAPLHELYAEEIDRLAQKMNWLSIDDQDSADFASGMADAMRKLLELAEKERVAEKEPHLNASSAIDANWRNATTDGATAKLKVEQARDKWLRAEDGRRQAAAAEENRKRQADADAAAAAETERLRKQYEQAGQQVDEAEIAQRVETTIAPVQEVTPEKARASAPTGRATSAKKVPVAPITDVVRLVQHFMDTGDANFADYMRDRAKKAQKAKITLPGVDFWADEQEWLAEKAKREAAKPGVPAEF